MIHEIPNNMSTNVFDTCELLWTYNGSNYSNSSDSGCTIPLSISCFSLLIVCVHDTTSDDKNAFFVVNDPTSPYDYCLTVFKSRDNTRYRRLRIIENGLIFSPLYRDDDRLISSDDGTQCIPYQIYGIR